MIQTYDQDGNRCDFDLSPAKFVTIADHEAAMKEKEEKCELYLRTNKTHLNTMLALSKQIAALKEKDEKFAILHEQMEILVEQRDKAMDEVAGLREERDCLKLYHDSTHGYQSAREIIIKNLEDDIFRQAEEIKRLREALKSAIGSLEASGLCYDHPTIVHLQLALKQEEVKETGNCHIFIENLNPGLTKIVGSADLKETTETDPKQEEVKG